MIGKLFAAMPRVMGKVFGYESDDDIPVNAGDPLDPNLNTLPCYTVDFRETAQGDNKYSVISVSGVLIVRVYHELPANEPSIGKEKAFDLSRKTYLALRDRRQPIGLLRLSPNGSYSEPVNDVGVSCVRVEFSVILK